MIPKPTSRLRFRPMATGDLDNMTLLLSDPAVMAFYPVQKTRNEAAEWIAWNERNYTDHGFGLWIVETDTGEFVGDCGLTWQAVNGVTKLEVGYHVRSAFTDRATPARPRQLVATSPANICITEP